MKRLLSFTPWLVLVLAIYWVLKGWMPPKPADGEFDTRSFSELPVLIGGRVKPIDTVARNTLLILRGKQSLRVEGEDGKRHKMEAARWFMDVVFDEAKADQYPVFTVHNQELLDLLELPRADKRDCTYAEIKPHVREIDEEGRKAGEMEASSRNPYQTAVFNLRNALFRYQYLKSAVHPEGTQNFADEIRAYADAVLASAEAIKSGGKPAEEKMKLLSNSMARYETQAANTNMLIVPPPAGGAKEDWLKTGDALIARVDSPQTIPTSVMAYAEMGDAYRAGDFATFERLAAAYLDWVHQEHPEWAAKTSYEWHFNLMQPFYQSMVLYVGVFLLAAASWLMCPRGLRKTAFLLLVLALLVHSFGMFSRMWIQGRPPVTNLYSSAIFVGWGAVLLGLVIEKLFKDGVGSAASGLVGFTTLIIAHHLGSSGDTLEMMQAVLDSNFWLATHVVVITFGYSAMFLAGFIAIAYVVLALCTRIINAQRAKALSGMVYGIICFATLFSFVGTVLGGIWADQSWGRFWGWDPKENGALLIVLWCGIILHARWGGMIRQRGLMAMAIFGNAITAFSWFGVNMLGVGLHSYGFMDKAFPWLLAFIIAHGVLILMSRLPLGFWRSFKSAPEKDIKAAGFELNQGA